MHVNMYILSKQMNLRCRIVDQKADMGENLEMMSLILDVLSMRCL